jgi:proline iminopeptidase
MFASVRETQLYFDIEGAGLVPDGLSMREKPVAFLVHGGPGADHTSYKPTFSPLSQRLQLVYFDHRGQGRSARGPKASYTLENNVEDMEALRAYLGLEKMVVIGGSYGGMVAMTYASRYPDRVSHLIIYATAPDARFLDKAKLILAQQGTLEQRLIAQHLWQGSFRDEQHLQEYFETLAPLYSLRRRRRGGAIAAEAQAHPTGHRAILSVDAINVAFSGFLRTYDVRPDLHRITAPTLILAGRHDWICQPELSVEMAQLIPRADLRIFEGSGHAIREDEPEALLDAIAGFLVYKT